MASYDKDFVVKNGLVIQGIQGTISGNAILTTASSINSLQDINLTGIQNTNVLMYQNGVFVPTNISSNITVSDLPPENPTQGKLWFSSSLTKLFVYYVDGTSNQWIEASSPVPNIGQIDCGFPNSNYGGTTPIDMGYI